MYQSKSKDIENDILSARNMRILDLAWILQFRKEENKYYLRQPLKVIIIFFQLTMIALIL